MCPRFREGLHSAASGSCDGAESQDCKSTLSTDWYSAEHWVQKTIRASWAFKYMQPTWHFSRQNGNHEEARRSPTRHISYISAFQAPGWKLTPRPLHRTQGRWGALVCEHPSLTCARSVAQSRPTLCDPIDCSLPGSSVHGILQARILEWVAISFSRGSFRLRDGTLCHQGSPSEPVTHTLGASLSWTTEVWLNKGPSVAAIHTQSTGFETWLITPRSGRKKHLFHRD